MGQFDKVCHMPFAHALCAAAGHLLPLISMPCALWARPPDTVLHWAAADLLLFEAHHDVLPTPLHAQRHVWQVELL